MSPINQGAQMQTSVLYHVNFLLRWQTDHISIMVKNANLCHQVNFFLRDRMRLQNQSSAGWFITLCKTSRWLQNKSSVLAWPAPGQAKAELLFWSQWEVLHNTMGHPVCACAYTELRNNPYDLVQKMRVYFFRVLSTSGTLFGPQALSYGPDLRRHYGRACPWASFCLSKVEDWSRGGWDTVKKSRFSDFFNFLIFGRTFLARMGWPLKTLLVLGRTNLVLCHGSEIFELALRRK